MDTSLLTRSHLETLSTAELIKLSDEYGIDIPENLSRRFIIGELLEAIEEMGEYRAEPPEEGEDPGLPENMELPDHYNETAITAVMRNPAWCYIYWDVSDADRAELESSGDFDRLVLHLSFFESRSSQKPKDSFDIGITLSDRDQFVLIPADEYFFRVDLCALMQSTPPRLMAHSRLVSMPRGCPEITSVVQDSAMSPVMKLSGLSELIQTHYKNHRQSFS